MARTQPSTDLASKRHQARPLVPDRELMLRVLGGGGDSLRQCVQCATCSAVCGLAAEHAPLPRKEMLWAQWGIRERLMADVDLWLCHECHDCTTRCPRGARPGDVMAALRQECVVHYSVPRALGRAATQPRHLIGFVASSAALFLLATATWGTVAAPSIALATPEVRITIPFCAQWPHRLLIPLFGAVLAFDSLVLGIALARFWRALGACYGRAPTETQVAPASTTLTAVLWRIIWHRDFARCTDRASRRFSHTLVVYSMVALSWVALWVITARYNPMNTGLVYPMGWASPWKLLANVAGSALIAGCLILCADRLRHRAGPKSRTRQPGTYFDWLLLLLLLAVAVTGFATEALHFMRLDTERTWAYSLHLVTVLTFFAMLPYSKLAHMGFRMVAMVFAERYGHRRPVARLALDTAEVP